MSNETSQSSSQRSADIVVSAPGKVILFGEHSVVYGRLALAASLGLRTRVAISSINHPNTLEIECPNLTSKLTFNLETLNKYLLSPTLPTYLAPAEFSWESPDVVHHETLLDRVTEFLTDVSISNTSNLKPSEIVTVKSMMYLIAGILGSVNVELKPAAIVVSTDLEIGAGTGSSASFLVSISAALVQYIKLNKSSGNISKTGYRECNWNDSDPKRFSTRELDIICNWAFCAEKIVHGTPSGLDNSICTYGSIVEFRKGLQPKLLGIECPFKILLINTKVARETKALVAQVAQRLERFPDLVKNILNAMEDVAYIGLQNIMNVSRSHGDSKATRDHYDTLATLCSMNHHLLSALGVSHPTLDDIVNTLTRHGLHGKLTGAGGGGYAIALLPPLEEIGRGLEEAMNELASKGFGVQMTDLGGEGVRIDSDS
ncbi:unnamed protein product [Phaedon cochleariae]|uniref:Mevalonate kinase n=1 Tax=Phaedon cochleariae TaxID=80249 RepID=A0A9P0GKW2_PHACE|nr:unnamed protein product [Phaedon cochleariae]